MDSHLKHTSEKVYDHYKSGDFCDCTLTSGQTVVQAHRIILGTVDYFYSMFSRGWKETITASVDLTLTIPEEILSSFIEVLYLGSVELKSIEHVLQLFRVADKFFMGDLVTSLSDILSKSINASTCLIIMQTMVHFHGNLAYRKIYDLADTFWLENTLLCSRDESYLNQPWSVVSHLLLRDEYNDEEVVFTAGMNWFEYSPICRAKHVGDFLTDVIRLPQLSSRVLSNLVVCHPLLKSWDIVKLERLVCNAFVYHGSDSKKLLIGSGETRYLKRKGI